MMEEALVTRLRGAPAVAALLATYTGNPPGSLPSRKLVDWITRPDKSGMPAVTLTGIDTGAIYAHGGRIDLQNKTVQIDCWANSYGAARALARAVIAELEQVRTTGDVAFDNGFLVRERDMMAEDIDGGVRVFRVSFDFSLWFKPS